MRLLIVEDEPALVTALRRGLAAHGFAVDAAGTAADAVHLVRLNPYGLVVLDLGLPDADGLDLVRALRAGGDAIPVLVLTARGTLGDRVEGLDAGADDYLQKPFAFPELVARIRALLRRGTALTPAVLHVADVELDPARLAVRRGGTPIQLTVKEFAILEYLLRHAGELVTRATLLEECWDESYQGLSNLVDVHVGRLRRKLGAAGGPPLVHTVRGAGFVLEERV
jgi:two-component system OmpR family response regulator